MIFPLILEITTEKIVYSIIWLVIVLVWAYLRSLPVGTKSLLFGVHQFVWHPFTVILAWHRLYSKWPSMDEFVAIVVHDWGYWGSPNMDGPEGEDHPKRSADIILEIFSIGRKGQGLRSGWFKAYWLVKYHSRHLSRKSNVDPSPLCYADKYSMAYDPWWLYLPRAWASGELEEYRQMSSVNQWNIPLSTSHRVWYKRAQTNGIEIGLAMDANVVPYQN